MSGRRSRTKGHAFERHVARLFRARFGEQVHRGWQARDGADAPDVVGVPGLWVECKRHRRVNIQAAYRQAVEDWTRAGCPEGVPVAVTRDDRGMDLVTLRLQDLIDIVDLSRYEE